ncbi:UDP-N-acetylmuramoyl-tripeptide--D-alanyl-D-alanine ligase [Jhaorihella thermophila]|uniref:UDP-N-acetylmuramoyl-tripeptide--D-alanyl-D-alanine ligase n=1 Tax=Jhaorihella thermophila TaxID=488547 RepID=A0A1H5YAZ5_9RHOB|nr:UDP-N-acetylmuramoyl-tripeptide--D-alanyl-D-alanine ligase [Jhaorihella thermophila]SEG20925.1 UDP-N-acetylmuramoyl-tripeptide--D-alanyl-D-alanine ligase [Jhaorihella thermophila]
MTLWTAAEAVAATGGETPRDWAATGVSIDTRSLQPGDLFVALKAARDGHDFVAQALEKGAAAALVSRVPAGVAPDAPLLLVDDVQAALEALGRAGRARCRAHVVAVTGSVGKTSTKEMLAVALRGQGQVHASVASYNNHWGVPLTLARMPRDTDFAVIEIGMNRPGEIAPLARMARPHVALITTVAPAHLEAFDSVEAIAREKAAILEGLEPGGTAILNADIPSAQVLFGRARDLGVAAQGFGRAALDWRLGQVAVRNDRTVAFAEGPGGALGFTLNTAGAHFAMNALGALAACAALGADSVRAARGLTDWAPYQGRGVRETVTLADGPLDIIDDSYNANPTSMEAALAVLAATEPAGGRRIAILGDMKELGPRAAALHAALADTDPMQALDRVHCVGPLMRALHDALPESRRGIWRETGDALLADLPGLVETGDIVLIKGSNSVGLGRVVDAIRKLGQGAPQRAE